MASFHVPVHDTAEAIPEGDTSEEDPFDDNLELTFPPMRYTKSTSISKPPQKLRRDSSRERDRLYQELVGHAPFQSIKNGQIDASNFFIALDVSHYKPEEITMKVEGNSLIVSGKHYNNNADGYESSEFQRKYTIPDSIDPHNLTSNISNLGILYVKTTDTANTAKTGSKSEEPFVLALDVPGYRPDEISIRVKGHTLILHGETRDENANVHGPTSHHQQFTRHFSLPFDIDIDTLSSKYTKDKKLTIEATRGLAASVRQVEIKEE